MTRSGELAGHLLGYEPELLARAIIQTIDLGAGYAVIPVEAYAAAVGARLPPRHPLIRRLDRAIVELCDAEHELADLDATAVCLLPAGHDGDHGYRRFLAHARLEARFAEARRRLR